MIVVVSCETLAPQRLQLFLPVKTMFQNSRNPLRPKGFKVFSKCPRFFEVSTNLCKVSAIERQLCNLFVPPQLFVGGLLLSSGLVGAVLTHHLSVALPDEPRPALHAHTRIGIKIVADVVQDDAPKALPEHALTLGSLIDEQMLDQYVHNEAPVSVHRIQLVHHFLVRPICNVVLVFAAHDSGCHTLCVVLVHLDNLLRDLVIRHHRAVHQHVRVELAKLAPVEPKPRSAD